MLSFPGAGCYGPCGTLLISVDGLNGGVQAHMNPTVVIPALLPDPLTHHGHDIEQGIGLIDSKTVNISPKGAGSRQSGRMKEPAKHCIETDVDKMPQPVKSNKQEHQDADNHQVMAQFRLPFRSLVSMLENLFKLDQVQKLDQRQYAPKGAQQLRAGTVSRGSRDFTGAGADTLKSFTVAPFPGILFSCLNHLGYPPFFRIDLSQPYYNR